VAVGAAVLGAGALFGDGGSIPFNPNVKIFEPNQRAMIAWNGEEEILVLSTDLRASAPTKVLEVFPFPAEPVVTEGNIELFANATELINEKLMYGDGFGEAAGSGGWAYFGDAGADPPPAARLAFHETIGSHDVAVIQALRMQGFVEWVRNFLDSQHVDNPVIPPPLTHVIEEYIQDGFTWFAFDVVSLTDEAVSKQAIQFRFWTNCLYYPLRITRTEQGATLVTLLILTNELLSFAHGTGFGIPRRRLKLAHKPVDVSGLELAALNEEMYDLLGNPAWAKLRIWEIRGILAFFENDLIVCHPAWKLHRGRGTARMPPGTAREWED